MKIYFPFLDGVRFFAAFWVMNFHYLFVLGLSSDLHWYRYGNLGVQLFFIISGFVIVQSIQGKTTQEFAIGRFVRLFPLFWILCTLTYIITLIVPHANSLYVSEYLVSMTMFGDTINGAAHNTLRLVDPSYWTLTVELIFYIAVGSFAHFFTYKKIRYFLLFWLLLSITAFIFHIEQNFYIKLALVRHASYFIFGGALALLATKQAINLYEKYFDWSLLFLSALYSLYIHSRAIPAYLHPNPLDSYITSAILLVFFLGVGILVYTSRYIKNPRMIQILLVFGGLSYPLYLLHQTIGNIIINYVTDKYHILWNNFAIGFEVFIIIVAYIIYIQDKKIRAWLQKKIFLGKG